jgi:hypothetical protein
MLRPPQPRPLNLALLAPGIEPARSRRIRPERLRRQPLAALRAELAAPTSDLRRVPVRPRDLRRHAHVRSLPLADAWRGDTLVASAVDTPPAWLNHAVCAPIGATHSSVARAPASTRRVELAVAASAPGTGNRSDQAPGTGIGQTRLNHPYLETTAIWASSKRLSRLATSPSRSAVRRGSSTLPV